MHFPQGVMVHLNPGTPERPIYWEGRECHRVTTMSGAFLFLNDAGTILAIIPIENVQIILPLETVTPTQAEALRANH